LSETPFPEAGGSPRLISQVLDPIPFQSGVVAYLKAQEQELWKWFSSTAFLILAVAARYVMRVAADGTDDYLSREFLQLGQELTWAPIRDGIIFSAGSALLLAGGSLLASWSDHRPVLAHPLDTTATL